MEREDYWNNEIVLYKTRADLSSPAWEDTDISCLVTDGHVVIETSKPIIIPVSQIKHCGVNRDPLSSDYDYRLMLQGKGVELNYLDDKNIERDLLLEISGGGNLEFWGAVLAARERQKIGHFSDEDFKLPKKAALHDLFRDRTRDEICEGLQELGMAARMVKRGRPEENIGTVTDSIFSSVKSLGIIRIPEGHIRWVNVCKKTQTQTSGGGP